MLVSRLHAAGDVRLHDEERPVPSRTGESLVEVTSVGICGSDLHWFTEGAIGDAAVARPLVLGHEMAGVIRGGADDGVRVAIDPAVPCGRCEPCDEGNPNLCLNIVFAGHGDCDGGLRQFLVWPSHRLHRLPDAVSDDEGAMLEPLGVALHALDLAHMRMASTVAVVGCGPIGLLLVQLAFAHGATRVLAAEPLPHRMSAALKAGAEPAGHEAVADVVFEVSGSEAAVDTALRLAKPGARVVLVGIPDGDRTSFSAALARRKGLSLVLARRMGEVYPRAIALTARGLVDLKPLATDVFPLSGVSAALETASARTGLKVLVHPQS
ncbi:alcohol dehydrogenase catalytic domain-containing protein [Actinoplanes bogorensis]|uniref:Alcohol dehydrogenase catalytic domain-containing protein n=1 Tax=Paractinoplanes bogorensis TaxID=1610840 RepID=A0ABS5Z4C7_9ACTN|nr:alcohol dehydrogenase catalytic domain-containing protein [Actinoplanes bogorensis]MBU2670411.1 alcohol dehydrogenase catalytic domain-containing protein [Actinoplanes bogorensis]